METKNIITHLQIIRTWAKVDGESGRGIDPACCKDIVKWVGETLDFISRSALLAAYDAAHKGPPGGARKLIEEAQGVDAAPVEHGHWEEKLEHIGYVSCSVCHDSFITKEWILNTKWGYCPVCGAKMDGSGEIGGET